GAEEGLDRQAQGAGGRGLGHGGGGDAAGGVQVALLDVGQGAGQPAPAVGAEVVVVGARPGVDGEVALGVVVGVDGDGQLVQVVLALDVGRGFADLLDGGEQQADQDRDDRDDDEQLDQCETGPTWIRSNGSTLE